MKFGSSLRLFFLGLGLVRILVTACLMRKCFLLICMSSSLFICISCIFCLPTMRSLTQLTRNNSHSHSFIHHSFRFLIYRYQSLDFYSFPFFNLYLFLPICPSSLFFYCLGHCPLWCFNPRKLFRDLEIINSNGLKAFLPIYRQSFHRSQILLLFSNCLEMIKNQFGSETIH
mgnify:FL=1